MIAGPTAFLPSGAENSPQIERTTFERIEPAK